MATDDRATEERADDVRATDDRATGEHADEVRAEDTAPSTGTPTTATPTGEDATPSAGRRGWFGREYSEAEVEEAKQVWRDMRPWETPMRRADKILIGAIVGALVLGLVSLPFRPFLIASHPVGLAAVTGSSSAIGAGAAFARIGETQLWLVILAGIVGKTKFDWLWWWAGRRWGARGLRLFVPSERAQRFVERVRSWPTWALALVVVASALPGIPAVAAYLLAGLGGMSLAVFLLSTIVGAGLMTGLVAGLGYGLGQAGVDAVLLVDRYALWITLAIALVVGIQTGRSQNAKQKQQRQERAAGTEG